MANEFNDFLNAPLSQSKVDPNDINAFLTEPNDEINTFLNAPDEAEIVVNQPSSTEDKSLFQKVGGVAKSIGLTALEAITAPFELAGEGIRFAGQGGEFRLPKITRNKQFEFLGLGPEKQGLLFGFIPATNKVENPPQDFFAASASGLQGLNELSISTLNNVMGFDGGDAIQKASDEVKREKDQLKDLAIQLPLAFATGQFGSAPLVVAARLVQKANPFGKLTGLGNKLSQIASKTSVTDAKFKSIVEKAKRVDPNTPLIQRTTDVPVVTFAAKNRLIANLNKIQGKIKNIGNSLKVVEKEGDMALPLIRQEEQAMAKIGALEAQVKALELQNPAQLGRFTPEINRVKKTIKVALVVFNRNRAARYNKYVKDLNTQLANQKSKMLDIGVTPDQIDNAFVANFSIGKIFPTVREGTVLVTKKGTAISKNLIETLETSADITKTKKDFGNLNFLVDKLDDVGTTGSFRAEVFDPIVKAVINEAFLTSQSIGRANKMLKANSFSVAESTTLRQFIESGGKIKPPIGREKAFKEANKIYRKLYDELLDAVNGERKSLGLDKITKRDNYIQHISDLNVLDDLGTSSSNIKTLMFARSGKPSTPFEFERLNRIREGDLVGAIEAFESYAAKASRFINQARNADKLRALEASARVMGKPNLSENFRRIADRLTGDSARLSGVGLSETTGGFFNPAVAKIVNKLGGNFAKNVIFGNLGVLVNQVGSQVLASAYIGPRRSILAIGEGLTKNLWEQIIKANVNKDYRMFASRHSKVVQIFERELVEKFSSKTPLVTRVMRSMFNFVNDGLVVGTFNQAYKAARSSGRSHIEAVKVGDLVTARAQALYVDVLRPSVASSSSKLGQLAAPMSTYVLNAANMIAQDVVMAKLPLSQKVAAMGRMAATGILLNLGASALTGRESVNAIDFIPYMRIAQMGISGAMGAAVGGVDMVASALSGNTDRAIQKAFETGAIFLNPLGGGLQAIKTSKGLREVMDGKSPAPLASIAFGPQARKRR